MDMNKGRIWKHIPILFILLTGTLAACNGGIPEQPATVISEPANIESVSLIALGQTPVKIHASIQGTYPNDCTLVYEKTQEWVDEVYEIEFLPNDQSMMRNVRWVRLTSRKYTKFRYTNYKQVNTLSM